MGFVNVCNAPFLSFCFPAFISLFSCPISSIFTPSYLNSLTLTLSFNKKMKFSSLLFQPLSNILYSPVFLSYFLCLIFYAFTSHWWPFVKIFSGMFILPFLIIPSSTSMNKAVDSEYHCRSPSTSLANLLVGPSSFINT